MTSMQTALRLGIATRNSLVPSPTDLQLPGLPCLTPRNPRENPRHRFPVFQIVELVLEGHSSAFRAEGDDLYRCGEHLSTRAKKLQRRQVAVTRKTGYGSDNVE